VNVSQRIVTYLRAFGVRRFFGQPGDPSIEVLEAARCEGPDFVRAPGRPAGPAVVCAGDERSGGESGTRTPDTRIMIPLL
jgi:hypothetical protein